MKNVNKVVTNTLATLVSMLNDFSAIIDSTNYSLNATSELIGIKSIGGTKTINDIIYKSGSYVFSIHSSDKFSGVSRTTKYMLANNIDVSGVKRDMITVYTSYTITPLDGDIFVKNANSNDSRLPHTLLVSNTDNLKNYIKSIFGNTKNSSDSDTMTATTTITKKRGTNKRTKKATAPATV